MDYKDLYANPIGSQSFSPSTNSYHTNPPATLSDTYIGYNQHRATNPHLDPNDGPEPASNDNPAYVSGKVKNKVNQQIRKRARARKSAKYRCIYCNKTDESFSSIEMHLREEHKTNIRYECGWCEESFDMEVDFEFHCSGMHPGQEPIFNIIEQWPVNVVFPAYSWKQYLRLSIQRPDDDDNDNDDDDDNTRAAKSGQLLPYTAAHRQKIGNHGNQPSNALGTANFG